MAEVAGPVRPEVLAAEWSDIAAALALGWRDFLRAPLWGLFFGGVYAAGGILLWFALGYWDLPWMILPLGLGFPLLGPFAATGLYEISRRLEAGEAVATGAVLGVVFRQKDRQLPSIAAVILGFFLVWSFVAHTLVALFVGMQSGAAFSTLGAMLGTADGIMLLVVGTLVGAGFAFVLFGMSVVALPLLLDREVDFVSAMILSFAAIRAAPGPMLGWGVLIAGLTFAAMVPAFLGLLVVLPVLGHASWHLYRRVVR